MNTRLIELIREEFHKQLETKTGWGRNDIKLIFERALSIALSRCMDEENDNS